MTSEPVRRNPGHTYHPMMRASLFALALLGLTPTLAFAQSRLAGVVKDTTGAVLPGVTVEASSPVLIEKTRTVVTDSQGAYLIVDLRPGVYAVTFTLSGFAVVKRDGIDLPASFTATVNADLRVGQVEETLTVTGQAPLVDVREATRQKTVGQTELNSLPILTRDPSSYTATIPGVTGVNLGGLGFTQKTTAIHGGNGAESFNGIDGITTQISAAVGGGGTTYYMNQAYIQEVAITLDAGDAEQRMSGISSNVIPKEGGNRFSGFFFTGETTENMVSNNVGADLKAKGFSQAGLRKAWDVTPAFGGPIVKDKLWFYNSYRVSGLMQYIPNLYINTTPTGWAYTPDLNRPVWVEQKDGNAGLRLTWQANSKNKFSAFTDWQPHTNYNRNYGSLTSLEATTWSPTQPNTYATGIWRSPVSSRLLLEAGIGSFITNYTPRRDITGENGGLRNEMPPQDYVTVSKTESSTGVTFGSPGPGATTAYGTNLYVQRSLRASASYVTGTHAFKAGFSNVWGYAYIDSNTNGPYSVTLLNGRPNSLTEWLQPNGQTSNIKSDLGIFVKDDWTMKRLTLNLGLRYDYFNAYIPDQTLGAGYFAGARELAGVSDVPNVKDFSPRIGVAFDLFGDGKTAIKGAFGRYVVGLGINQVTRYNPVVTSVLSANRTWSDTNGNFVPDCVLTNPLLNGECAQISNLNFGQSNPASTQTDPDLIHGFGVRDFYWTGNIQLDRQLTSSVSVSGGYFRSSFTAHSVTDNLLVTPADYDPYCITAPLNPGLPSGGGYQVCGLYDVKPALAGRSSNLNTLVSKFGTPTQLYNGFDLTTNMRLPRGGRLSGGVSTGRTANNNCYVVDSPQNLLNCDTRPPFQPNIRFSGSYPLPMGFVVGGVFSNIPGAQITASYSATNAQILPSLGRFVSASPSPTALVTVPLIAPGTMYADRQMQMDLRLGKRFSLGRTRLDASVDFQNLFNEASIQIVNTTYGTTGTNWLNPTQIQNPRYLRLNLTVDF